MQTDFSKLANTKHMLAWLSDDPFNEITETIERIFIEQSPSTKLLSFEVLSEPEWLTAGR